MDLSIATEAHADAHVVDVGGDLDVYTAPQLKAALDGLVSEPKTAVLDLSRVHFIDSTALGVLAAALQEKRAAGGEIYLVIGGPHLLKIFRITGFHALFRVFSGLEQALEAV